MQRKPNDGQALVSKCQNALECLVFAGGNKDWNEVFEKHEDLRNAIANRVATLGTADRRSKQYRLLLAHLTMGYASLVMALVRDVLEAAEQEERKKKLGE